MIVQHQADINEKAWREYRSRLLLFIRSQVKDHDVAEDILQDVLLKIWTERESLRNEERLLPWMYRIARNGVVDYYRAKKLPTVSLEEIEGKVENPLTTPEEEDKLLTPTNYAERELATCVQPMIETLPQHYQRALTLADISGLSQTDLANREGISISGAKSRVQRGRQMLKEMIVECCRLEFDLRGKIVDYAPRQVCNDNCAER
ncbi:MAG: RNA polymerase sigma factor SigZ [Ignavibacteriae bacterium]|nr:RNA polymerase sigma factor SigZ [Ignavibacteriota bacterium]MCB9214648.1 RNA polymerase sigma factor SigZ [Ignavibacteria bacterium]